MGERGEKETNWLDDNSQQARHVDTGTTKRCLDKNKNKNTKSSKGNGIYRQSHKIVDKNSRRPLHTAEIGVKTKKSKGKQTILT